MLGRAEHHRHVPTDPRKNVPWRLKLMDRAGGDAGFRGAVRQFCKEDILFYTRAFVWQYNPAKPGHEIGPFLPWGFQERALLKVPGVPWDEADERPGDAGILWSIENRRDLLVEKSREEGVSWLCLIVQDWMCLFHDNKNFLDISHTEEAVDKKDKKGSLFWKLRFMHKWLPHWLTGEPPRHKKLLITYPRTDSSATGAATTERSGVGDRATAVLLDEFAKQKDDVAICGSTADVGPRIFVSTHYGQGTEFYRQSRRPDIKKLVLHWSQHPDKNRGLYEVKEGKPHVLDRQFRFPDDHRFVVDGSPTGGPHPGLRSPWYDAECERRRSRRDVAMHLDIDPEGSVSQFFDPLVIRTLQGNYCHEPYWTGDLLFDPDTGRPVRLVPSPGGPLSLWLRPTGDGLVKPGVYGVGGDIAAGTGATPSCLCVGNAETGEKVGEYFNAHISPERLAALAVALCWLFKTPDEDGALFCWEMQGPGVPFGKKVMELGYRRVYFRKDELGGLKAATSDSPGWVATPNNKRVTLEEYRAALHSRQFLNRSRRALEECLAFRYTPTGQVEHGGEASTDDPSGARVNHGDLVIADALCWKMVKSFGTIQATRPVAAPPPLSLEWRRQYHARKDAEEEAG